MLQDIRWILFDAVGTLIYADPPVAEVYHTAARQFGSRLGVDEIAQRFRCALANELGEAAAHGGTLFRPPTSESYERERWRRIVAQVIDDVNDGGASKLFEQLWQHFAQPHHWRLFDDVSPALSALAARGYRLGIASNFDRRLLEIIAGHPALRACGQVFVSSELGFTKPDSRFFRAVTSRLGVPADEILLVGDDERNDFVAAGAAGWRSVLLNRSLREPGTATIHALTSLSSMALPDF